MPAEYYNKVLYPIQDKVIKLFKDTPFYLSGGTALSRGYYNHRYSDDLDYFVNDNPDFLRIDACLVEAIRLGVHVDARCTDLEDRNLIK